MLCLPLASSYYLSLLLIRLCRRDLIGNLKPGQKRKMKSFPAFTAKLSPLLALHNQKVSDLFLTVKKVSHESH